MKTRESEIDKAHKITEQKWVLTMARKSNGSHPQHAFLIVEGIENDKAVTWFMDFVGHGIAPDLVLPNVLNGQIRIQPGTPFTAETEGELERSPLIYRCKARMMDLHQDDIICSLSWPIDKEDAIRLIKNIRDEQHQPPVFNIFGKDSLLAAGSAASSSKAKGHNCFTYAKEKINGLHVQHIKVGGDASDYCLDRIACITSLTLKDPRKRTPYCPYFTRRAACITSLAIAGIGLAIEVARRHYSNAKPG